MSPKEDVERFFQAVCQDKALQDKLKSPCPANRQGFVDVAQEEGYSFTTVDIDNYVRFYQFYQEFQAAIERHQSRHENLSNWLKKWHRHVQLCDQEFDENDKWWKYLG